MVGQQPIFYVILLLTSVKSCEFRVDDLPDGLSAADATAAFEKTAALANTIGSRVHHLQMQELSMGMSNDYALAVPAGATMIRLAYPWRSPSVDKAERC